MKYQCTQVMVNLNATRHYNRALTISFSTKSGSSFEQDARAVICGVIENTF